MARILKQHDIWSSRFTVDRSHQKEPRQPGWTARWSIKIHCVSRGPWTARTRFPLPSATAGRLQPAAAPSAAVPASGAVPGLFSMSRLHLRPSSHLHCRFLLPQLLLSDPSAAARRLRLQQQQPLLPPSSSPYCCPFPITGELPFSAHNHRRLHLLLHFRRLPFSQSSSPPPSACSHPFSLFIFSKQPHPVLPVHRPSFFASVAAHRRFHHRRDRLHLRRHPLSHQRTPSQPPVLRPQSHHLLHHLLQPNLHPLPSPASTAYPSSVPMNQRRITIGRSHPPTTVLLPQQTPSRHLLCSPPIFKASTSLEAPSHCELPPQPSIFPPPRLPPPSAVTFSHGRLRPHNSPCSIVSVPDLFATDSGRRHQFSPQPSLLHTKPLVSATFFSGEHLNAQPQSTITSAGSLFA